MADKKLKSEEIPYFSTPVPVIGSLEKIAKALAVYLKVPVVETGFYNSGAEFKNEVFEVHAYDWGDDDQPYNFKCGEIEITWYKHCRRGSYINRRVTPKELKLMEKKCIDSLV